MLRLNTQNFKNRLETVLIIPEGSCNNMQELAAKACSKLGFKKNKHAKIYNKEGVEIFEDDLVLLKNGDVVYIACQGMSPSHPDFQLRNSFTQRCLTITM